MNKTQLIGHTITDIKMAGIDSLHITLSSGNVLAIDLIYVGWEEAELQIRCKNELIEGL